MKKIERNYLEINSLKELNEPDNNLETCVVQLVEPKNFHLNKFFYKNVGKSHNWVDRLVWSEKDWIKYTSNQNVKTYVLKKKKRSCRLF